MTRGLTDKQERILTFIVEYVNDKGYPPSIREIGNSFHISSLRGVAVRLGDEATVKHIQYTGDGVKLIAANPAYDPIEVRREDSQIIGKVIGLIRNYDGVMAF